MNRRKRQWKSQSIEGEMMEASAALSLQSCSLIGGERARKKASGILRVSGGFDEERRGVQLVKLRGSRSKDCSVRVKSHELKISCCYKKSGGM